MKRVLITGCAGFIGSSLSARMLKEGFEVIGVDAFIDHYPEWIKRRHLQTLLEHKRFTFVQKDIRDIEWDTWLRESEAVVHLAALPGVRSSWGEAFHRYAEHNIVATQRLLEAVKRSDIQKMIYASSSSIYGKTDGPVSESRCPHPISPYGVSKWSGEQLAALYHENEGVPVTSLRFFTVYGPRQRPDMAFHRFIRQIMRREPVTVYGDGRQKRDFTYIDDVVEAVMLALARGRNGEAYNIGRGKPYPLHAVIERIGEIIGVRPKWHYQKLPPGDPLQTWADISKAEKELGYRPQYELEAGLVKQIASMEKLYE